MAGAIDSLLVGHTAALPNITIATLLHRENNLQ
ncbi:MAG: hypothetical protein ACI9DH_000216 [Halioglobus sp.]|jgi:hypothetical protein